MDPRQFVGGEETPFKIDTATSGVIFLGYPVDKSNPNEDAEVWAIQKIIITNPITPGLWKGGTQEKKFTWSGRTSGTYRGIR